MDVKTWIDERPISKYQWVVLSLCFIIIMFDGYDAAVMGFIAPALIEDWGISRAEMGPILGAAMFGVAIGALIAGPNADRFGAQTRADWSILCFALFKPRAPLPYAGRNGRVAFFLPAGIRRGDAQYRDAGFRIYA